jgi:RNA polymerase sigma-70 factor, ECF subfamily
MWPDSDETQQLLKQALEGDRQAIDALLDRHRQALVRLVALRLDRAIARRVDASDIVQDVLVEANRRLDDYLRERKMPFHLWLRQIAQDRSIDREQPLNRPDLSDRSALDLAAMLSDRQATPATAATRRELQERFRAAIDQLDGPDREVILMRHFEELSNQEVAQTLELSEAAAGMRYLRAIRRLRIILDVPDEGDAK